MFSQLCVDGSNADSASCVMWPEVLACARYLVKGLPLSELDDMLQCCLHPDDCVTEDTFLECMHLSCQAIADADLPDTLAQLLSGMPTSFSA